MIGYLKGKVIEVSLDSVLLDVGSVGYEIQAPLGALAEIQGRQGETLEFWIHTHVREDALSLFGFLQKKEKELFLQLLKVNGVGPKSAMNVLSGASFEQIHSMIENEDARGLSKLPKVGKKTAEQMILTLKGKLVLQSGDAPNLPRNEKKELVFALTNLGFRSQDVERVVSKLPVDQDLETGLKAALAALTHI